MNEAAWDIASARRGRSVALLARGRDGLEGAPQDVEEAGGRALVARLRIAGADAVFGSADRVGAERGGISGALEMVFGPVEKTSAAEFKRVTERHG